MFVCDRGLSVADWNAGILLSALQIQYIFVYVVDDVLITTSSCQSAK